MVRFEITGNRVHVATDSAMVKELIEPLMRFQPQGYQYSDKYKSGEWTGWISLYRPWDNTFPRGFLNEVVEVLEMAEVPYEFTVKDHPGSAVTDLQPTRKKLRPYQQQAIGDAVVAKRGIICLPTGTGKTLCALEMIRIIGRSAVIFVHTKELMAQWEEAFAKEVDVMPGHVGDGDVDLACITIAMVQTASKLPKQVFTDFGITIFDECHHVAAEMIYELAAASQSEFMYGLSATPYRSDGKDLVLKGALGGFIVNLNTSDMIKAGWLAKPTVCLHPVGAIPYGRGVKFPDVYRDYIVDNPDRNALIAKLVTEEAAKGRSVYVHVKHIRHGETLHKLIPNSTWIHGKNAAEKRRNAISAFVMNGGILISTLLGEGVDVPGMNTLVLACGGQSAVFVRQLIGRVLRITADKKEVKIIDFMDCARYLSDHAGERRALYESEPAFEVVEE